MKKLFVLCLLPVAIFADARLANESELGLVLTSGNSSAQTLSAKHTSIYTLDANKFQLAAKYLYGKASGMESAKNWSAGLRYERAFTDSLSAYLANTWEGDIFNGYEYRTNVDAGGKYYLVPEDKEKKGTYLFSEVGYRYTYEYRIETITPRSATLHFARIYLEGSRNFTDSVTGKLWVEGLPSLNDANSNQANFEASLAVMLSEKLSLKSAYGGRYRSTALKVGGEKYDSVLTTSLIAKF